MIKIKLLGYASIVAASLVPSAHADSAAVTSDTIAATSQAWQKPVWLTDLSLGIHESYDNNILLVSGNGMQPQSSWITAISPKVGFNFASLLGDQSPVKTLTLLYAPDINIYHDAPQESYDAQKVADSIKVAAGHFAFNLDNAFLYNNGSRTAPVYAESQTGNTDDKFRNFYAQAVPRERRDQIQDRGAVAIQYDWNNFFVRPTASTIYYDLNTVFHNAGAAPYIGYQNWPSRYDVNGGADAGYKLTSSLAVTLGYRYGHQYQGQFPADISSDRHYSSNNYQRALLGLEGNVWSWLTIRMSAGPDFRDYNSMAPVNDSRPLFAYAEASATATLTTNQSLAFYTKEWEWVASTGLVPYYDSTYTLNYHWNTTRHWGFDLGGKVLHATYSSGNDLAGSAPSLRDDIQYTVACGVTYNFTPNLNASVTYNHDWGRNLDNLPSQYEPAYRNFDHDLVSLGMQYKF